MNDLFDSGKTEYKLFDSMRRRFIPKLAPRFFDDREVRSANDYFVKSLCPHFEWKSENQQRAKSYAIKR